MIQIFITLQYRCRSQLKKGNDDEKKKKILNKFSKFMTILKNIVQWKIEKRLKK